MSPSAKLVLVGSGPRVDYYKEYVENLNLDGSVRFYGLDQGRRAAAPALRRLRHRGPLLERGRTDIVHHTRGAELRQGRHIDRRPGWDTGRPGRGRGDPDPAGDRAQLTGELMRLVTDTRLPENVPDQRQTGRRGTLYARFDDRRAHRPVQGGRGGLDAARPQGIVQRQKVPGRGRGGVHRLPHHRTVACAWGTGLRPRRPFQWQGEQPPKSTGSLRLIHGDVRSYDFDSLGELDGIFNEAARALLPSFQDPVTDLARERRWRRSGCSSMQGNTT